MSWKYLNFNSFKFLKSKGIFRARVNPACGDLLCLWFWYEEESGMDHLIKEIVHTVKNTLSKHLDIKMYRKCFLLFCLNSTYHKLYEHYGSMSIIASPLGFFLSYLLLWWYFHLDHGYFTQVNVQYIYEVRQFSI